MMALLLGAALSLGIAGGATTAEGRLGAGSAWAVENVYSFGQTLAGAGDVNGDGYDDVIVGAPFGSNDQSDEGLAYLYLGSASGLSSTPAWVGEGNQDNANFGYCVAGAGDVNHDGYDDVIVGAPGYSNGQYLEGRVFLYLGSAAGLSATPAVTAELNRNFARFGYCVAGAGDVNHDGYDDVIIGQASSETFSNGGAYLFLGSAAGLGGNIWTAADCWSYGEVVAGAGDVNRDGYDDVLVAAPYADTETEQDEGRVYLYLGAARGLAATPAWTYDSKRAESRLGASMGGAGDVNGDGYDDVIVGAPFYKNPIYGQGRACLFLGSATGLAASPAWTRDGEASFVPTNLGYSVAGAGDANGDGRADVIVGAPAISVGGEAGAYLHLGALTGLAANPAWTVKGEDNYGDFGYCVAGAGDVNHDGYADFVVGAPGRTQAFLYLGGDGGRIAAAPAALDFLQGSPWAVDVEKGGAPTVRTLTLTNATESTVTFSGGAAGTPGLAISGRNAGDFAIAGAAPSTGTPLKPGAAVTISIRFAPTATRRTLGLNAALAVTCNSAVTPTLSIPLTGDAVPVELSGFRVE